MKPIIQPRFFSRFCFCLFLLWGGISHLSAQAQTPVSCGTDDYTKRLMATDSAYRNFVLQTRQVIQDKAKDKAFDGTTDACQK